MITTQLLNTTPYTLGSGMATKIQQVSLPEVTDIPENDFCYCKFECDYISKVFGAVSDDFWKNDKFTFLFRRLIAADTVTIKLFKSGVEVATITDNTYGEFIEGYPSGTPEQQLYVTFTIFWQNVFLAFGGGEYTVETELFILGATTTQESQIFRLYGYSDAAADGTVRIESVQNGNIKSSEFDFTGLNLYQSDRLPGKLTEITPEYETDEYLDTNFKNTQIQSKVVINWLLKVRKIPRATALLLTRDTVLANEILVTDYNIINEDIFRRESLTTDGIDKPDIGPTTRPSFEITFKDRTDNKFKRNN